LILTLEWLTRAKPLEIPQALPNLGKYTWMQKLPAIVSQEVILGVKLHRFIKIYGYQLHEF
jgi:hypothetical protein